MRDQIHRYPEPNLYGGVPGTRLWNRPPIPIISQPSSPWAPGSVGLQSQYNPGTFPGSIIGIENENHFNIENNNNDPFEIDMNSDRNFGNFANSRNVLFNGLRNVPNFRRPYENTFGMFGNVPNRFPIGSQQNEPCYTMSELSGLLEQTQFNNDNLQFNEFNK